MNSVSSGKRHARAMMQNAQMEEFKHFGMDLEFLLRKKDKWKIVLQSILFKEGDIVELGERGRRKGGLKEGGRVNYYSSTSDNQHTPR